MTSTRVFELRTYYANEGKLDALKARFENHTFELFARHGLELVAFLTAVDEPASANTLVYVLAGPDRATYDASFEAFRTDPDWLAAKAASEVDGPLVAAIDSTFLAATPESPLQ